ncbi:MAG: nucleotidyltransferase domain-containing protein [Gammaproteobacteria bacterium]|nr:nucleotidyltransferase domain-containing protein [Gammaproteobacteria bacterium]
MASKIILQLSKALKARTDIKFSILFGSRARGTETPESDWDIAIWFKDNSDAWENLGKKEDIRNQVCKLFAINETKVDIVDLARSELSINATVVDEGIELSEQDSLALAYYYQGVWSKIEEFYWNLNHAA